MTTTDDPLRLAGVAECGTCGDAVYPVDAVCLPGGLVLTTYRPTCGHSTASTVVVDPALFHPARHRCTATTKAGTACRNPRRGDSPLCHVHARRGGR